MHAYQTLKVQSCIMLVEIWQNVWISIVERFLLSLKRRDIGLELFLLLAGFPRWMQVLVRGWIGYCLIAFGWSVLSLCKKRKLVTFRPSLLLLRNTGTCIYITYIPWKRFGSYIVLTCGILVLTLNFFIASRSRGLLVMTSLLSVRLKLRSKLLVFLFSWNKISDDDQQTWSKSKAVSPSCSCCLPALFFPVASVVLVRWSRTGKRSHEGGLVHGASRSEHVVVVQLVVSAQHEVSQLQQRTTAHEHSTTPSYRVKPNRCFVRGLVRNFRAF